MAFERVRTYEAIVLGASAGGMTLVRDLISALPADLSMPLIVVQHLAQSHDGSWIEYLAQRSNVAVKEADEKEVIVPGTVYLAPANYHLLVEPDRTFTLTVDQRVNYARPSIDVLFETAAEAYRERLVGVILTGANSDGAQGLLRVKECGGLTVVQDPRTAEVSSMPMAAIRIAEPEHVLDPSHISQLFITLHQQRIRIPL
jgi:two-component system, chemotaxis family, protein-glutamate methylesterase/glutaminase